MKVATAGASGQKWHGLPAGTVPENNLALRDKTGLGTPNTYGTRKLQHLLLAAARSPSSLSLHNSWDTSRAKSPSVLGLHKAVTLVRLRVLTLPTDDLVSTRAATAAAPACLLLLFCQKDREASLLQHRDVITLLRGNHAVVMSSPCCEVIIQEQHLLCTGKFQVL